jgi:hypothetical protein
LDLILGFASVEKYTIIGEKKMRIEKAKGEFIPLTITLESPEELMFMWHRMNLGSAGVFQYASESVPRNTDMDHACSLKLYREIDEELKRLGLKKS